MKKIHYRTPADLKTQIDTAMGSEKPDLLLINGEIINTLTGEQYQADICIKQDRIVRVGDCSDLKEKFPSATIIDCKDTILIPGLIDSHIHTESAFLPPTQFAATVLPHGTTTVVVDPHEIGNVTGKKGIEMYAKETMSLPLEILVSIPSCVPATTHLETGANVLTAKDLRSLIESPNYFALAEMMNFPGVYFGDPDVLEKLSLTEKEGKLRDGHAPGLSGNQLQAYLTAGITSDHECSNADEAIEKIRLGMTVQLREGSFAKDLVTIAKVIKGKDNAHELWKRIVAASDDRHADELLEKGHLDHTLRILVNDVGIDPIIAIQMCTINTATYLERWDLGALAPGRIANVVRINNLKDFKVLDVVAKGKHVAHENKLLVTLPKPEYPSWILKTVKPKFIPEIDDFFIAGPDGVKEGKVKAHIIGAMNHSLVTEHFVEEIVIKDGRVQLDESLGYIFVLDRYGKSTNFAKGLIKNLNFKVKGGIASTVGHDSHQLILCGNDPVAIHKAMMTVIENNGGQTIAFKNDDGSFKVESLPLPYGGIMSIESAEEISKNLKKMKVMASEFSETISEPFMAISFMALPVIPKLKLTDKGLVDVEQFKLIEMFEK